MQVEYKGQEEKSNERPSKSVKFKQSKQQELKRQKELEKIVQEQKQIRDQLTRELKYNELSLGRGFKDWQKWCEDVTCKSIRNDLQVVAQSLNKLIDKSNHAVDTIKIHREHADEQYLRNFHQHSELVDYIMSNFRREFYFYFYYNFQKAF